MKKVYQEIMMSFYIEDEKDIDEVLFEMDIDSKDTTGKTFSVDWQYRDTMVEER